MKTEADKRKLRFLMGSLAIVALFINGFFLNKGVPEPTFRQQAQQAPEARQPQQLPVDDGMAAKKAAEDAAAEHRNFLAQYLNADVAKKPGIQTMALVVATERGGINRPVSASLVSRFKAQNVEMIPDFFKPSFVTDNMFASAFDGSSDFIGRLDLAKSLDSIVLARQTVQYSTNPSLLNVLTASMRLEVVLLPVSSNGQGQTWTFSANGAGFKQDDARAQAEERLIKQIANATNLSLQ